MKAKAELCDRCGRLWGAHPLDGTPLESEGSKWRDEDTLDPEGTDCLAFVPAPTEVPA